MLAGYILQYTFTSISSIAFLPNNLPNVPLIQVAAISSPEFVQRYVASANDMFSSDELPTTCKAPTSWKTNQTAILSAPIVGGIR